MSDLLTFKGYFGSAQYSAADEVFHGKLEGIDDLVTYEATTVQELIDAFREAVEDYLEMCKDIGKEPNKTYKGSFNVRIPGELHREAAVFAASKDISLNDFVKTAIQYALINKGYLQGGVTPRYSLQTAEEAASYRAVKKKSAATGGKKGKPGRGKKAK
ncbi:MAG TPA: type II toxin-antitoxin system HicB family antitoxin [Puia sp.]|nr:type II toxin-antitoxin system HicB family antitoxin [Puia sp.]